MIEIKKIAELKELITSQANDVEKMINNCINGLLRKEEDTLNKVINIEEKKINLTENKIDEVYTNIFALYRPEAKDLRTVLMISKMNYDLERIADHCVNISESALFLIDKPDVKPLIDLPRMAEITINMLKDSINAFFNEDEELAKEIMKKDEIIDNLNQQIFRELVTYMISDPRTIERALNLLRIANNLEKIADLTTNICEQATYIKTGKIVKHHKSDNQ